ncbi:MAG: hypothetical protein LBU61_06025 [Coriobacteriales bacterium]|jgi:hypothetical protein|nr:hypothetical protein [Coriobacteriales bacterium]
MQADENVEVNLLQQQKSFVLPRLGKLAGVSDWPAPVPHSAQVNEFIPEICRLPYDYLYRDSGSAMAECTLLVWEYTGLDMMSANLDFYNFEAEAAGAKMVFSPNHMPAIDCKDYLVKGPDDLEKIRFTGLASGRMPYMIEYQKAWTRYCGLEGFPSFCAPWSLACNLFGPENLLVACVADPEFTHELLRRCTDDLLGPLINALNSVLPGLSSINCVDAWFSPPLIGLDVMEEYEPYIYRVSEAAGLDLPVIDGGIWGYTYLKGYDLDRLTNLVVRASRGVRAYDPDVTNIGPEYFRGYADRQACPLLLGLSTSMLQDAPVEEIVRQIKYYMLVGKDGVTPFTFFFNNIAPFTPLENVFAAIAAVNIFGDPEATAETVFEMPELESFESFLKRKMIDNAVGYTFDWLEYSGYAYLT